MNPANPTRTVSFTITPPAGAAVNTNFRIGARYGNGASVAASTTTGYTDGVIRVVAPAEGLFHRFGNWAEYNVWLEAEAPLARRLGRSAAVDSMPIGSTKTITVDVHNWSTAPQSGAVSITGLPAGGPSADANSKPYGPLAPDADTSVTFDITNTFTNATIPTSGDVTIPITTTYDTPALGSGSENLRMSILPKTSIPVSAAAPVVDGQEDAGVYSGQTLDLNKVWQGTACSTKYCGGTAKVVKSGDALYFFMNIIDDYQAYAILPVECAGHWQSDSVEILIDPRGNSSQILRDTANTFKLGVFPYSNDPTNSNGTGVNGPCWERDADNHQGYSVGPLQSTVHNAPNALGVQVATTATWVGSNSTLVNHAYGTNPDNPGATPLGYKLEVKIPIDQLPADLNETDFGLNITPYDNDNTAAAGTTTLRHIDSSTRTGWSAFGSVQSDPYRWGRASIAGSAVVGSNVVDPLDLSSPNLDGAKSPQTIAQSAHDGVPISGRDPAGNANKLTISNVKLGASSVTMDVASTGTGTMRAFLWSGEEGQIPVYTTSCSPLESPSPDYGLTACNITDGGYPSWSPDQSGRVQATAEQAITAGTTTVTIPVTAAQRAKLRADGSAIVSYVTSDDKVQAFDLPLASAALALSASHVGGDEESPARTELRVHLDGTQPWPGDPTGTVQFAIDGTNVGQPVPVDENGDAVLRTADVAFEGKTITATYSGDGDYVSSKASRVAPVNGGPTGPTGSQGTPGSDGTTGPIGPTGGAGPTGAPALKARRVTPVPIGPDWSQGRQGRHGGDRSGRRQREDHPRRVQGQGQGQEGQVLHQGAQGQEEGRPADGQGQGRWPLRHEVRPRQGRGHGAHAPRPQAQRTGQGDRDARR